MPLPHCLWNRRETYMEKLYVDLGENSYDIKFTSGFSQLPQSLAEIGAPKKILIVTDTNVQRLYADEVGKILSDNGYNVSVYAFEAGEQNKNMDSILKICAACMRFKMDRNSMIAALGGGVTGDMAGFAAAIYMRGIRFIQIPTTLLAQSDSSVGGKTGIDFDGGKNILGAFHQPKLVYINVNTLKTLPEREFISGMGEVIKHGIIRDAEFFDYLDENYERIKSLDSETLIYTAKTNCKIKADVVMNDERETGLRAILNFGHTIGHAVESAYNFTKTHGECVGIGMIGAAHIALGRGIITKRFFAEIEEILKKYGFTVHINLPDNDTVWSLMQKDKKKLDGKLKFVLPTGKGRVIQTTDVSREEIIRALGYIRSGSTED